MFDLGQRVVCIHPDYGGGEPDEWGNRLPCYNGVYLIRGFVHDEYTGKTGILLEEIVNPPRPCAPVGQFGERAFNIEHFRPVRNTSIDEFKRMLAPVGVA